MHYNRCDFVVCMSDLCSKCPLIGLHKIQTKEIKCRQFSPSPCLFAQPEAVSKHSVSLWIGYSEYVQSMISCVNCSSSSVAFGPRFPSGFCCRRDLILSLYILSPFGVQHVTFCNELYLIFLLLLAQQASLFILSFVSCLDAS